MVGEGLPTGRQLRGIRLRYPIGGQVASLPCDGHCVVSEALVVATDEGGIDCWFHAVDQSSANRMLNR